MSSERATTAVRQGDNPVPQEAVSEQEQLAADLQHLYDLLERDAVEPARRYIKELEQRWPESERVRHYAHVLAPPVARTRPDIKPRSRDREFQWLKEHAREYPGCWLAVHEDRLIAADPDYQAVLAKVRETLGGEGALLFHQSSQPRAK